MFFFFFFNNLLDGFLRCRLIYTDFFFIIEKCMCSAENTKQLEADDPPQLFPRESVQQEEEQNG